MILFGHSDALSQKSTLELVGLHPLVVPDGSAVEILRVHAYASNHHAPNLRILKLLIFGTSELRIHTLITMTRGL